MKKWLLRLTPVAAVGLLLAVLLSFTPAGCGPSDTPRAKTTAAGGEAADPWPKFVAAVRNNPDPKATRGAVADLSAGLASTTTDQPGPADLDAIAKGLNLTDAERKQLAGGEYTQRDANHLSECFYLFDAASALGVAVTDPVPVRAAAAFRFVCRQVVLRAVVVDQYGPLPPVPPAFVLNHLSGSGLERALVFVALCRQLDLDAYLIGPPEAAARTWTHPAVGQEQPPKGPFWAVGVRDAGGVLLYDPWRGEPVPTAKAANRPATLAELRADPSACPWLADKEKAWGVTADEVKASGLFLSPPLESLSPRMALLQGKVKAEVGVQVAVDWAAAVRTAEGAAAGAPVGGWNPKGDPTSPVRALARFLPADQGGLDATADGSSLFVRYQLSMLPTDKLSPPVEVINGEAKRQLHLMAAGMFANALLVPPTPREKIQRGQHIEATRELVGHRDRFANILDQIAATPPGADPLTGWYAELDAVYDKVSRARVAGANEAELREEALKFLKDSGKQVERVLGGMVAEAGVGETTYLLALTAHEQAEAAEVAVERAAHDPATPPAAAAEARRKARAAWGNVVTAWKRFAAHADAQANNFPGRKENAAALLARAEALAK